MGCGASSPEDQSGLDEASVASKRALSQLREYETRANLLANGGNDEPTTERIKFG